MLRRTGKAIHISPHTITLFCILKSLIHLVILSICFLSFLFSDSSSFFSISSSAFCISCFFFSSGSSNFCFCCFIIGIKEALSVFLYPLCIHVQPVCSQGVRVALLPAHRRDNMHLSILNSGCVLAILRQIFALFPYSSMMVQQLWNDLKNKSNNYIKN